MQKNFNLILFGSLIVFSTVAVEAKRWIENKPTVQQRRIISKQIKDPYAIKHEGTGVGEQADDIKHEDIGADEQTDGGEAPKEEAKPVFEETPKFDPTVVAYTPDGEEDTDAISQKAKELTSFIVDTYLGKLQSSALPLELKKQYFKECFERYFNVRQIAGFVLGRYGRAIKNTNPNATEEEKKAEIEEYKKKFVEYFVWRVTDVYTRQFDNFRDVAVKIISVEIKEINKKKYYEVHTVIDMNNDDNFDNKNSSEDMKMIWTCVVDKNSKVVINDVNIGGISLRTTLQEVVQSEIKSEDFAGDVNKYIDIKAAQMSAEMYYGGVEVTEHNIKWEY